ncbi:tetratricopeptide repeat protein [Aestuariispira insulae]|uniref:Putative TPR repeat methyltransferase n=1 Tax=Aestuariispira insulae TaxID=1461337 RepID=A0A3D9HF79_9PROT|nr:methyltransferase [Aestuariispira insulae]RED48137.1 putative TPR repeat methyltransferase [Aestuariispira insulae]
MTDGQNLDSLLAAAMDQYREDRYEAAAKLYDSVLAQDPDNLEALGWRGEIAIQLDEYEVAAACLQKNLDLDPDGFEEYGKLGLAYYELEESEKSVRALLTAIERDDEDLVAHSNLGRALYDYFHSGAEQEAARIARDWVKRFPDNPDAAHMGAAVGGLTPPEKAVEAYVADVFDVFAQDFDQKLEELGYCAPQLLETLVKQHLPEGITGLDILDAGCGTGLCGPLLKPLANRMDGVDLSSGMLEKAADRGLYDDLAEEELVAFLKSRRGQYDLVVAADVLCYFGALEEAFAATHDSLRSGGTFAFSLETRPDTARYHLHPSGRYSHEQDYVLSAIRAVGFVIENYDRAVLRSEYGEDVKGLILLARRP